MAVRLGARPSTRTRLAPRKATKTGSYGNVDDLKAGRDALGRFLAEKKAKAGKNVTAKRTTRRARHARRARVQQQAR